MKKCKISSMKILNNALNKLILNYNTYTGNKGNFQWVIKRSHPRLFNLIQSSFGKSFNERVYCILNNINTKPKCKQCSEKSVSFKNINHGYKTYCSDVCAHNDPDLVKKRQNTMIAKYGVAHALQVKEISKIVSEKNKIQFSKDGNGRKNYENTMQERYNVSNPMEKKEFREKISTSHQARSLSEIKKTVIKRKQTNRIIHGDENYRNIEKTKKTLHHKYGVEFSNQLKCSKDWLAIKDKKMFLEEILPSKHPIKIAKDYNLAFSTVYKLINKFGLKDMIRKTFNTEYEINQYIQSLGLQTNTNNRSILSGKEIDILIPEKNIGIEHNGIYWHSELNGKDKNYHLNKTLQCEQQGIQLLHIFETEWLEKEDIVKSIISSKLGKYKNRLYARKCIIREIDSTTKNNFLKDNHLQGPDKSSVKLGLFNNGELVGLMTFGKSRYNNKYQYEMHRFCNKLGYQIVGGASKLLKYFINYKNPLSIITYADRRYSDGSFYEKIGFIRLTPSMPSHWYFGKDINGIANRLQFQKHLLEDKIDTFDPTLTAWQNMVHNGYDRIWDCGNHKFEWLIKN